MSRAGPEVLFGPNKDLRGSRSLLFISFKKGHTSDIRPATLSSWLKQTILLCYKQADQPALDLVQVKTHDIAASKAFYGGVSVDQIMQACHWKAHNTFTNFYLRPYLVGHRQQYVSGTRSGGTTSPRSFPSDQLSSERKKGGGGGGTSATTKSTGVSPRIYVFLYLQDVTGKVIFVFQLSSNFY